MDKNEIINRLKYLIIFTLATLSLEVVAFWSLDFGFLPKYLLFDLTFIIFISAFIFVMNTRKGKLILIITILSIQLLLNCVNACYNKVLGDVFSFDLLKLGDEATKVFEPSFIYYEAIIINLIVFGLFVALLCVLTKNDKLDKIAYKKNISFAFLMVAFIFISSFGLMSNVVSQAILADCSKSDTYYVAKSDTYLYNNFHLKQETFKKFGTCGFYIKSLEKIFTNNLNLLTDEEKVELIDYISEGYIKANNSAVLHNDNLIVIMVESMDWFSIDPYCTPNLYDLANNSAQCFTNFRVRNKTNMSENIVMLGNTVKDADFSALSKSENFKPKNSLAYMFREQNYTANYFHSYDGNFYDRYRVNTAFGYETVFALQDSGLGENSTFGNAYLETDFLETCIDRLAPTDKSFYSFYTTFGTHGSYDNYNSRYETYYDFYEDNLANINAYFNSVGFHIPSDKKNYNRMKEYKCAMMDTDKMIGTLFAYLEDKNLLNNTSIVIYGDHNCYYNDLALLARYENKIDYNSKSSDIYNIPLMIYSKKLGGAKIDTFCSTYDIYPTICELFGLEYNKNLTQGYNLFSLDISNSVFVSNLSGIFTDDLYSINILDVYDNNPLGTSPGKIEKYQLNAIKFYEKQYKIDRIYIYKLYNL